MPVDSLPSSTPQLFFPASREESPSGASPGRLEGDALRAESIPLPPPQTAALSPARGGEHGERRQSCAARYPPGEVRRLLWTSSLGCRDYEEVRAWQERLVARRRAGEIPDVLLVCSHPPVVTAGRATTPTELAAVRPMLEAAGIPLLPCERGGRLTYHGPGQVIAYPIMHLGGQDRDLHAYQRRLEAVVLATLARFGVLGDRRAGLPGVWVGEAKIASVGIAVRGWVTWHGLALNLSGDLRPFRLFSPCGIKGLVVTSLAEMVGRELRRAEVEEALVAAFVAEFGCERKAVSPQDLR